ncbi:autophagy-related protein 2 homolog A-like [Mercenaria mercenaria]|uniref:autophagy-related protein 2 homolog A-like n=1 Tax=Mercenaria mercenaria TaxID=6596 RepID=UPI00234EBF0D|nr:autophagy-related protein 2 homolog A-like [Mercenaria mercenaria]
MSWTFGNWQDFLKKKACRYILQHYLGQFLKQKLSLDQLSLDLYNGMGKITDLNLDVQAINEDLASFSVPVELVDGFVEAISVSIPWSALIQDSTTLEVTGLELTLQPKSRDDHEMTGFDEMFSSMQTSMTTSLQLAKDCLESETESQQKTEPIEGVQKFALMIDSVLSKIRVSLSNTVIRLEHHPDRSEKGVAMEIRIKRIEYFDDMATVDGTSVDGNITYEPAAINQKNVHFEGVQLYFDEITNRKSPSRSRSSSSEGSPSQMFTSARSTTSTYSDNREHSPPKHQTSTPESNPIQVAVLTGKQEIKLKTKQNDTLHGPKLEIVCQFGGLHFLLSPQQLHGIIELMSGLTSPGVGESGSSHRQSIRNKPMDRIDFEKVEVDLQHQLQSGRIQSNNLAQMQDYSLHGDDDDQFYSLMTNRPGGTSDMDSSFSSNYSTSTNRTTSSTPSSTNQQRGTARTAKDVYSAPKYHEDPSAELSHYYLRVAFFSVTLFHNNMSPTADKTALDVMKDVSSQFFQRVGGVSAAGVSELKEIRKQMTSLVTFDHLRLLGRPLTVECNQKSALKQISTTFNVTVGIGELIEALFSKRSQSSEPQYSEILTFPRDGTEVRKVPMYSSMQGGTPCFNMQLKSLSRNKRSSRPGYLPQTDIIVSLGQLQVELDVTLVDRINTIITPEKIVTDSPLAGASLYHTVGPQFCSLTTLEEGPSSQDQRFILEVTSPLAKINLRFPIPDLRQEPHVDKSWYQRNLRDDVLIVDLENAVVRTSFITGQPLEQVQFSASDIHGYYKMSSTEEGQHFAHVNGEGGEDGFNNPTITLKFCDSTTSVLDEEIYMDDTLPLDSLNGACQFAKSEPSPFSSRRNMHDSDQQESLEKTEQMVLPADRDELNEFMQKSVSNTKMVVEIVLPNVVAFLPNKHFFEVLYNRLNNDMLLWEPSAPAPVTVTRDHYLMTNTVDVNVYNPLHSGEHFSMAKSGLLFDSDTDEDESVNHYSIHDSRYSRRKRSPRQQQSKMCLNLNIGKGRLTVFTEHKDTSGVVQEDKHGEVLMQISDLLLFTVSAHNGDPNIQFVNVLVNKADLYHTASVMNTEVLPLIECGELTAPVPPHLQHNHVIYRSEPGVLVNTREDIGTGSDSQDMVSVAVKIKLDTLTSKRDLISDEIVKEFLVSVGLKGATMRHKVSPPYQSVFIQMMDFLDVKDYPILGYMDPKVLTELHVHLWTCAIDYRPTYLPLRSVILADSFSISSNIVAESSISLLRFVLDDGALYISKKTKNQRTDLRKDYVCVADIGRLELLLKSNTGNDPHFPKTDLRVSSNLVNIRTCADSCQALIELIKYVAGDGDLYPPVKQGMDIQTDIDLDTSVNTEDENDEGGLEDPPLTKSSMDHVHNLMSEAMQESSGSSSTSSKEASPDISNTDLKQTEVFFVADSGATGSPSLRDPIVITQNIDASVTSSTMSARLTGSYSEDEDSDDFCMIDDTAWGTSANDGEPAIRVLVTAPVEIKDNHFSKPIGRTDLLKAPENFPQAESRYTLKELTLVWYIYGGSDLTEVDRVVSDRASTEVNYREGMSVSFHRGSPDRWSGHAGGREVPLIPRETLLTKGGPGRNHCQCMELQLTKVRFQHEEYPLTTEQASRQVLLISDIEVRDRIKSSKMNKFLYQYSSDDTPRQTYANMVHVKAIHSRPNPPAAEEECALKVSLQPIRLNVDQDTGFFLKSFFTDLAGGEDTSTPTSSDSKPAPSHHSHTSPPPPVMTVNKEDQKEASPEAQDLLMQFNDLTNDLQASFKSSLGTSSLSEDTKPGSMKSSVSSVGTITSESARSAQPVFFKSFVFSPDVPIRLDYHGKFDREHGALAGLGGLVSLNRSELRLKSLTYKQGLLGSDKVVWFCLNEWLTDIKVNQLPTILGGLGPMHSIVQLAHGVKDLFWLPVEQYRKDGRIIRGIQRGATSFSMSTAMSVLELTNRVVQGVQWCAEQTFDIVSPGPRRRGFYPRQPSDIREGVSNAYIVLREGFSDTASAMVEVATKEHETKGMMGAVGGVLRQIPPTIVQPLIIVPEATSNLIGGLRSHLKPDVKKEDEDKWKEEIID